jgi:DNA repair protein RecO (recombination protein O)
VGTSISEKGRNKSALALRPFTYGNYELFKNRDTFNLNSAFAKKSYYKIGEDVDKYMNSSYVLEFTEKVLQEGQPSQGMFNLIIDFFDVMENRNKSHGTLVIGYMIKTLKIMGVLPELKSCIHCGEQCTADNPPAFLDIKEGGIVCSKCGRDTGNTGRDLLIYPVNFGILNIISYFADHSLKDLEGLALEEPVRERLQAMIRQYSAYHLDIGELKSEGFLK